MYTVLWIMAGLLLGCLPFSYWVGTVLLKKDIRNYGDGNPGSTNVWNAGVDYRHCAEKGLTQPDQIKHLDLPQKMAFII